MSDRHLCSFVEDVPLEPHAGYPQVYVLRNCGRHAEYQNFDGSWRCAAHAHDGPAPK